MEQSDVLIIGGGIIGLATAYVLCQRYPQKRMKILEKENSLAFHQSGRNSGVLHTGIYYKPGSLKSKICRSGKAIMEAFLVEQGIPYEQCGKVIVATSERELPALNLIYERGQINGVNCRLIDRPELLELEPHANGMRAIHVPEAGITDYTQVCRRLAELLGEHGHQIVTGAKVVGIHEDRDGVTAATTHGDYHTGYLINCAGLYSDKLTKLSAGTAPAQIIPFRGEYYKLNPKAWHLCRTLIYPVPDPSFPFLGVHFTRMISGGVECGPNAVLAFGREGYHLTDVNVDEFWETLRYPGFRKLAVKYWKTGLGEMWRSASKAAFVKALQKLVPGIRAEHLERAPAGIRAQALAADGSLLDDFAFHETTRIINVVNAPSPAATSSFSVGNTIVEKLARHLSAKSA
jgi:L-2-hydroxyglutarate oxidase